MNAGPGPAASFGPMRRALNRARASGARQWHGEFIDMGRSEPLQSWPADERLDEALTAAGTRRYQPVAGRGDVLADAAGYYSRELGVSLGPENVLLTSGALTGITLALLALCQPGQQVLIPAPHYHGYPVQVAAAGRIPRLVPTAPAAGWRLAGELLSAAGDPPAGALVLANPANPTTVSYGARELREILSALPASTAVIADEVYADYVYEPGTFASIATLGNLGGPRSWVAVRSAAKTLGRPGLRIGVLLGPAAVIEVIADHAAAMTGGASIPAQLAFRDALQAVARADHVRPYRRRAEIALRIARDRGLVAAHPAGTYYLWVAGPGLGPVAAAAAMAEQAGVFALPGEYFGGGTHLRVSLSVPLAAVSAGLTRIADFIDREAQRIG